MKYILTESEKEEYDNLLERFDKEVNNRVGEENKGFWGILIFISFFMGIIIGIMMQRVFKWNQQWSQTIYTINIFQKRF